MRISTVRLTGSDNLTNGQFFVLEGALYQKTDWDKAKEFTAFGWGPERRLTGSEKIQPIDITGGKTQRDIIEV